MLPTVPALVLFDIDGTLLRRAGSHHREALVEAIRYVTDLETSTDHVPVHGMLDPDILTRMMRDAGASSTLIRRSMPDIIRRAQWTYVRNVPDLHRKTCPGARSLLMRLKQRRAVLALVTGNLTRIGWKKIERAGLKRYFRFGSFGEMAPDRAGLARLAVRHAREHGWISRKTPVYLIGDAPADIIAAKKNGIRSIAVYTGISTRHELEEHEPDLLLKDLTGLRLEMLLA